METTAFPGYHQDFHFSFFSSSARLDELSSSVSTRAASDAVLSHSFDLQHNSCPGLFVWATEQRAVSFLSHKEVFPRLRCTHIHRAIAMWDTHTYKLCAMFLTSTSAVPALCLSSIGDVKSLLHRRILGTFYTLSCWRRRGWLIWWLPGQCQVAHTHTYPFFSQVAC